MKHEELLLSLNRADDVFAYINNSKLEFSADLCVELSEALTIGRGLPMNRPLARELLEIAYRTDPLIGGYGLGRYCSVFQPDQAIGYFQASSSHGHIASKILCLALTGVRSRLSWSLATTQLRVTTFSAAFRLAMGGDANKRYWRYYDVAKKTALNSGILPKDREKYFPWTSPISLNEFALLCKQPIEGPENGGRGLT